MEIKVKGLMCNKCDARLKSALEAIGLEDVNVSHEKGIASFKETNIPISKIKEAVEDTGFDFVE